MSGRQAIAIRYRTDPDRIARVLPPPLEPDERAEVLVDFLVLTPDEPSVFHPGPYSESSFWVSATYRGKRGAFLLGMPLTGDWGRAKGREALALAKKDAAVSLQTSGRAVSGELSRRGRLIYRLDALVAAEPAHPLFWPREVGWGGFAYLFRLHPDWRRGPLRGDEVRLVRLGGHDDGYPSEPVVGPDWPRALDLDQTFLRFGDPSALDPFAEFPVLELLGGSYLEGPLEGLRVAPPRAGRRPLARWVEHLENVDPGAFEPWALLGYDRPCTAGVPWAPVGWPESRSAFVLGVEENGRLRDRPSLSLGRVTVLDIELELDPALHARMLPSPLPPGSEAVARILVVSSDGGDLSPEPFAEVWLLSRTERGETPAWFAAAHVVGAGGDLLNGRETLGYPSKAGEVLLLIDGDAARASGRRLGREFLRARVDLAEGRRTEPIAFEVIGLQTDPFDDPSELADARLVASSWTIELDSASLERPGAVDLELPDDPGPGIVGLPDPWFQLRPLRVRRALAGRGVMHRGPGSVVGSIAHPAPFLGERFDGMFSITAAMTEPARPTLTPGNSGARPAPVVRGPSS